jgi:LCP family protein required for cell wall assembly
MGLVIVGLSLLYLYCYFSQYSKKWQGVGKVVSAVSCIALILGSYYLLVTAGMLSSITGANTKTDYISIIVMDDDPATSVDELNGYNFGIATAVDRTNTDKALADVEDTLGSSVDYTECGTIDQVVAALYAGNVDVIVVNEAYRDTIEETYENFSTDTRIIETYKYVTEISSANSVNVSKEPFVVYISGNDTYGAISQTSRSDVNILAVVNPKTNNVLLLSTPRDSYVELSIAPGSQDKLTHSGIYGIDCSMDTLGNLYGVDINYYIRVNFTGFQNIIDALGGITIENDTAFTSHDSYYFEQGTLELDGLHALHYSRERKAFALGDIQRGINQMKVMKAMIAKMTSPAILTNYSSLMSSVSDSFQTNMSSDEISDLVKLQLGESPDWNIVSYNVSGDTDYRYTYSVSSTALSVVILNEDTVESAKYLINAVMNGEEITQDMADSLTEND